MDARVIQFIAIAVSVLYGAGFAVIGEANRTTYAVIGGVIVGLMWLGVGMLGKREST